MRLLVGLGNPGPKYEETRHNAGFWMLDSLAEKLDLQWQHWRKSQMAKWVHEGETHILLKPETFMNKSGEAVLECMRFYDILASDILVVADDVYLAPGTMRVRQGGSDGGHNGWKSVQRSLTSSEYLRARFGVGIYDVNQPFLPPLEDYVLKKMSNEDTGSVKKIIDQTGQNLVQWLKTGDISLETITIK